MGGAQGRVVSVEVVESRHGGPVLDRKARHPRDSESLRLCL